MDLMNQAEVTAFFRRAQPDVVVIAAGRVGGIHANATCPGEFIYENLMIQSNLIHQSYSHGVRQLIYLGSTCAYPKLVPQPMREDALLSGVLEPTSEPYAIAKIAGLKMCESYNRQYGTQYIVPIPTNLYGPNDNFTTDDGHVIPGLLRRFHEAKISGSPEVVVWGSGTPTREFLHVDDLVEACLFLLRSYDGNAPVNVGSGEAVSIGDLAEHICGTVAYTGRLSFDNSKPDGMPFKKVSTDILDRMGWESRIRLKEGLEGVYAHFLNDSRLS
jgi:GDP-L-fucose synthase